MIRSVRVRLAVWHTAVLAFVLIIFTAATFVFLQALAHKQTDRSLEEAVRAFQSAVRVELRNHPIPEDAAAEAAREFRFSGRRVLVYGRNHVPVAISDSAQDDLTRAISAVDEADDSPLHPMFAALTPGHSAFADVVHGKDEVRAYAAQASIANEPFTIVAIQLGPSATSIIGTFLQAAGVAIPLALIIAGLGGYFLARRSLAPVVSMGRQAAQISSESLDARLQAKDTGDELDELATVFNDMLARLERAFKQQRQFMADASHELRTPLASIRAETSVALARRRTSDEYEDSLERVRDEARRLSSIVDDLFTIARLDAANATLAHEEFFLEEVLMRSVAMMRPLAQQRMITVDFRPAAEARCVGDSALVDRVLTNLLDNAIKYTPVGGVVRLELEASDTSRVVRVSDTGIGIAPEAQPHIFDRFYRGEAARTRSETSRNGAGLGLSIARQIAIAHGGALELTSSGAEGTVFTLILPAA